jgi:pyridoxal phosphate enzyme (YggS family)
VTDSLDPHRRAELVSSLAAFRGRLANACSRFGRDPRAITLVAVTKGFPASDVAILAGLGVRDFGESRDQEARRKVADASAALASTGLTMSWHFVGRLQTNKCRSVARYADVVHSVDRLEVAAALGAGAVRVQREIAVFLQLSLDGDPARGGVPEPRILPLAEMVARTEGLRLIGVMAIAPMAADPRVAFAELARVADLVRARHPDAHFISAGMSADLEAAIEHGATHVRIGSALLGRRSSNIG